MPVSLLLAQEIAKLFLILLLGVAVVRAGLLHAADSRVLSVILVYLIVPCVILNAFQIEDTPELRAGLLFALGAAVLIHLLFLALTLALRRPLKLDAVERATVIYSNAGALVIPLVQALQGQAYVIYSCAFIIVQLVLLWTHGSAILRGGAALNWKAVLTNVNLLSIAAGAALYFLQIPLPALVTGTMDSVGAMMGPLAMLLAGMTIAECPLRQLFGTARYYLASLLRLAAYPLAALAVLGALGMAGLIPDGKAILMTVFLAAITPACATLTSMAQLYDCDVRKASSLYVLSTLLSILTMPVMIGLYDLVI